MGRHCEPITSGWTLRSGETRGRHPGESRDPLDRSRGLSRCGPRGRPLRWARGAGTGFARRHWNTGTMESCGSLLASGRANFTDGVRRLARHVPVASDPPQHPAPLHLWVQVPAPEPPATTGRAGGFCLRHPGESRVHAERKVPNMGCFVGYVLGRSYSVSSASACPGQRDACPWGMKQPRPTTTSRGTAISGRGCSRRWP